MSYAVIIQVLRLMHNSTSSELVPLKNPTQFVNIIVHIYSRMRACGYAYEQQFPAASKRMQWNSIDCFIAN